MATNTTTSNAHLGKRVDGLDNEVKLLGKQVGGISADIVGLNSTVHALSIGQNSQSDKLDVLLQRGGASEAVKDMIPAKYVTWGIGAFISLIAVGLTTMALAAGIILYAIDNNSNVDGIKDSQLKASIDKVESITQSKFDARDIKQEMNISNIKNLSDLEDLHILSEIEELKAYNKDFRDTYFLDLDRRVKYIETTRSEIGDVNSIHSESPHK